MKLDSPVLLMILDGWGINPRDDYNAVKMARTPNLDHLFATCPHSQLLCSGEAVGLPKGQMGNSEVGHLNMGAGRRIYQSLTKINKDLDSGELYQRPVLKEAYEKVNDHSLHLIGLVSDGGVHSHIEHLFGLLEKARQLGLTRVFVHAILDGRDTPPKVADVFLAQLEARMEELATGKVASIMGRYYGMDRDNRWERTQLAFDAMVQGEGKKANSVRQAIDEAFAAGETDEFVKPTIILEDGQPTAVIAEGDTVIFFNFRPDRARQITRALTSDNFTQFERISHPKTNYFCLTEYDEKFGLPVIYSPELVTDCLGEILSINGLSQLRIAETEKYAHVTFFFSGGREEPYAGEERDLLHSPKVATYDLQPQMSAYEVAGEVVKHITSKKHQVIILNFANLDMVGHTGILEAAIQAAEVVDSCVGKVLKALDEAGGLALITADHGNAEQMLDYETGNPHTAHTTNPVPFILYGVKDCQVRDGELIDISPTILQLLDLPLPAVMKGSSLIL